MLPLQPIIIGGRLFRNMDYYDDKAEKNAATEKKTPNIDEAVDHMVYKDS